MKWTSWIIALFLIFPGTIYAAVEITDVENSSNYDDDEDNTNPIIYGGSAGDGTSCTSTTSTCDNCSTSVAACNTRRINANLLLRIYFTDDELEGNGDPVITTSDGTSPVGYTTSGSASAGETAYIDVAWGRLCEVMNNTDNTCSTDDSATFYVGFDTDGDTSTVESKDTVSIVVSNTSYDDTDAVSVVGIDTVSFFPGDEKVYVLDISAIDSSGFPNVGQVQFKYLRVMFSEDSFSAITPSETIDNGLFDDLEIEDADNLESPELVNNTVEGLTNDVIYHFRLGLVDQANNFMSFTADGLFTATAECGAVGTTITSADDAFDCPYAAQPQEVYGLLTEDLNCFITTAAYGSSFATKVQDFRNFRDQFLLRNKTGLKINKFYYKWGSKLSVYISNNDWLKPIARFFLWPAWAFAKASTTYGLKKVVISIFMSLLFLFLVALGVRSKRLINKRAS